MGIAHKGTECKPPDWGDPRNLEAYSWCINHGVTISALATVAGFQCKSWVIEVTANGQKITCLLYTSPSPRDQRGSRMPSSA